MVAGCERNLRGDRTDIREIGLVAGEGRVAKGEAVSELVGDLLEGIAGRMEDVAQEAGVSYSALYSWATGRRRPGPRNLEKLARLAESRADRLGGLAEDLRGELRKKRSGSEP